jgi:hypothetical protein
MSRRVVTLLDQAFPDSPEWSAIAEAWSDDVIVAMLTLVWEGFDQMKRNLLQKVDFSQRLDQLERTLTDAHSSAILLIWKSKGTGFESFIPKHEPWELSSITSRSAMPPSYDIGFENVNDPRLRWPVEAKILASPTDVNRYLGDLRTKYLTGVGAPFSTQAALLGYLQNGEPKDSISAIQASLGMTLKLFPHFAPRLHHTSEHSRSVAGIHGGAKHMFVCHHLIAALR